MKREDQIDFRPPAEKPLPWWKMIKWTAYVLVSITVCVLSMPAGFWAFFAVAAAAIFGPKLWRKIG